MFRWTKDSIAWYQQASEYTGYVKEIFKEISPFIETSDIVADLGCGLGYLSLELASKASMVTAIDVDNDALDVAKKIDKNEILRI